MGPELIPILGIVVGIPGFIAFIAVVFRHELKKKEMTLRAKELEARGADPELGPVVDELRNDLDDTRGRLAEVEERLDFAERMLTAGRASQDEKTK